MTAILMDLSKDFDSLPYDLLLLKTKTYGLLENATEFIKYYLSNRKQCETLGQHRGDFDNIIIIRGVPEGSIFGPVHFNIFIDIFYFVNKCDLYNYADDNTLSCSDTSINVGKENLAVDSVKLTKWFDDNKMKQVHLFIYLLDGYNIACEDEVVLRVTIDFKLNFNAHISKIGKILLDN